MTINQISAKQTYTLRHRVLRPHQGTESVVWPGDEDSDTLHLGLNIDQKLVCVASFYLESTPDLSHEHQYRLRGMATHEDYREKGCGRKLLQHAAQLLRTKATTPVLWFNARTVAKEFYNKLGFIQLGNEFTIEGVGPHVVMYKMLNDE